MANNIEKEDWLTKKWRPMMGWTYMITCLFDFILGPILFNILQYYTPGQAVGMWTPLTLQGGGMYHIAMGAIVGVSAFGRTQEKLAITNTQDPIPVAPVMTQPPIPNFGGSMMSSYSPAPMPSPSFGLTSSGKKIIPDQPQPEL